jgi:hypothetical protein
MKEQTIWKYKLDIIGCRNISMPIGAEILTVQVQDGGPCLWALVDPKAETEIRTIEMFGTGHPVLSDMGTSRKYISTFQMHGGELVFHVFEYTGS